MQVSSLLWPKAIYEGFVRVLEELSKLEENV